ncbi:unnamed protein product, partial [Sphagnum balticum]
MMQARALHHDHFQQLSASQSSFVSPISSSRNQFRSFTPKSFGCCRPVTGSFSQCALSLKGGGRGGRAPPGVSCFPGSLRYRKRSADGRRMWHIAAQPSEPSTSTFNEEDYEEHEDTEEEARRRDWVERRWVSTQDNDWYYIRDFIKVGMHVQVEVIVSVFCHQLFVCVLLMLLVGCFTV